MSIKKKEKMNILVTGGGGFLGSHVADELTNSGHNVTLFDLAPSPYLKCNQKMKVADILDQEALNGATKGVDVIFHFAAIADIDIAHEKPYETMETNIIGTTNVLEAAIRNEVKKIVFASTIYVYSRTGSFYRVSKQSCELLIEVYKERYGLDYTILRFGTLYGNRSNESNSVYRLLHRALTTGKIDFKGTGEEVREYIHVKDAARICTNILKDRFSGEILILTGNHRMRISDLLNMIKEILGNKIEISHTQNESGSHYTQTPYSYLPRTGKKIVTNTYCDLGQSLIEILDEVDWEKTEEIINIDYS